MFNKVWMRPRYMISAKRTVQKTNIECKVPTDVCELDTSKKQTKCQHDWRKGIQEELWDVLLVVIQRDFYAGRGMRTSSERENIYFFSYYVCFGVTLLF